MTNSRKRKANYQGHTYKVGNSWRTVIRAQGKTISANASTQQESRKRAKEKLSEMPELKISGHAVESRITIGEFLDTWLREEHVHQVAQSTFNRYQGLAERYIAPIIGKEQLRQVNKKHVLDVLLYMAAKNQSPRSQQQARALLSVAFGAAVDKGYLAHNPVKLTKNIALDRKPISPLTQQEVRTLLNFSEGTFQHARFHVALLLGLRQGEALGLRWADINLDDCTLRVHSQIQKINGKRSFTDLKTDSSHRTIMFSDATRSALIAHRQIVGAISNSAGENWHELDLVFPNRSGEPIQSKWDYQRWVVSLEKCGIAKRSLHNARHTAGTLLYSSGADIETIRRILGHSSIALTSKTYVHSAEEPLRRAAANLEALINN
jgi:integrase